MNLAPCVRSPRTPRVPRHLLIALTLLLPATLLAQRVDQPVVPETAPAATRTAPVPPVESRVEPEKTVELSPFVVQSEQDTGYQATSTLAGTRLNTPIKDLGASISVYTKDFMNDIGATNANDLLIYATGMEAAGSGGNYSGALNTSSADQGGTSEDVRNQPQNVTRTRGLAAPNFTRDYFISEIGTDGYNLDGGITVIRGPNAILFGVGSPAGVVDSSLAKANVNRDSNKVEFRYGNNDSARAVLDFNRVIIPKKLAGRLILLDDQERFNQRPAFENKRRVYGAITYQPTRSTVIRGNFESGNTRANRPITTLPLNSYAQWQAAGSKPWDWTFYDDPARNPYAALQNASQVIDTGGQNTNPALPTYNPNFGQPIRGYYIGQAQIFGAIVVPYSLNAATADQAFRSTISGGTAVNQYRTNIVDPVMNRDAAVDGTIQFLETRNLSEIPGAFYANGFTPAGIRAQGFTDYSAFDFRHEMLDQTSSQQDSFHTFNLSLEQTAWKDRLGLQLAYYQQRYDRSGRNSFFASGNGNHIRIDPNVYLPTGRLNPHLGQPYAYAAQMNWNYNFTDREAKRATAYLRYDFNDLSRTWGKWLGRHTLTGVYEENAVNSIAYTNRLSSLGAISDLINSDPTNFNRSPGFVAYLSNTSYIGGGQVKLNPIKIPQIAAGTGNSVEAYLSSASTTVQGAIGNTPLSLLEYTSAFPGAIARREVIKSQAVNLQSYWLNDLLVTTAGWRRDEDYAINLPSFAYTAANPATKNQWGFNDFSFPSTPPAIVSKEVKSYGGVLNWPQKLLHLPFGSDLSIFSNYSENFTPLSARVNIYGSGLPSPSGKTREYGLNLSVLEGKISIRYNHFETSVKSATYDGPAGFSLASIVNNELYQLPQQWVNSLNFNQNSALQSRVFADIDTLYSAMPANYKSQVKFGTTGSLTTANLNLAYTPISSVTDTSDYVAKGDEIDLVYNPTRNWRILVNVGKQGTVQSNIAPAFRAWVAKMVPIWNSLADRPAGAYPVTPWQIGDPLPVGATSYPSRISTNVLTPLALINASEGIRSAEQREYRANLVTNYTFGRSTFLRGWSVGTGLRWQSKIALGYPASRDPSNLAFIIFDKAHPIWGSDEFNVDGWIGYSRRLWNNRIDWKVQLNVRNLWGTDQPIAVVAQPWGATALTRLPPERRAYISNTFSF